MASQGSFLAALRAFALWLSAAFFFRFWLICLSLAALVVD